MSKELITFSDDEKKIIKTQLFPPTATNDDMSYCMGVAKSLGLNPINKEIWFIERKANVNGQWVSKIEPMVGRDSFLKIAHRSGLFGGIEATAELKEVPFLNNGKWESKKDLVATAKVYKKGFDNPFIAEVNYNEYVQRTKAGTPTKFWDEKPHTMLKKVAESQALKKAFNITGVYDENEIRDEEVEYEIKVNEQSKPNIDTLKLQLKNKLMNEYGYNLDSVKEFAEFNQLGNDENKIKELLQNDEALKNATQNFEGN